MPLVRLEVDAPLRAPHTTTVQRLAYPKWHHSPPDAPAPRPHPTHVAQLPRSPALLRTLALLSGPTTACTHRRCPRRQPR
ncbi:hypothetical protein CLM82_29685, partial [Streptomyces albidoflavus]